MTRGRGDKGTRGPGDQEQPWTTGTWNGLPRWACSICSWDTLEGEEAMREHYLSAHAPRRRTVTLPLVDAKGEPMVVEHEEGEDGAD